MPAPNNKPPTHGNGSVTLVGAGPGDPELLTLRAVRALQEADVILIDNLVAPAILDFARREARKMMVGKTGYGPSCRQDEINAMMNLARQVGKARGAAQGRRPHDLWPRRRGDRGLPGGRHSDRGRARHHVCAGRREQAWHLAHAARAGAARAYITAHGANGRLPADIDWRSVADPSTTTVVYMPKRTLAELAATALAHGIAPDTPAIAVASATRPDEQVTSATIATIAEKLAEAAPDGPVIVMIGHALGAAQCAPCNAEAGEPPQVSGRPIAKHNLAS